MVSKLRVGFAVTLAVVLILLAAGVLVLIGVKSLDNMCESYSLERMQEGHGYSIHRSVSILPPGMRCTFHWDDGARSTVVAPWIR